MAENSFARRLGLTLEIQGVREALNRIYLDKSNRPYILIGAQIDETPLPSNKANPEKVLEDLLKPLEGIIVQAFPIANEMRIFERLIRSHYAADTSQTMDHYDDLELGKALPALVDKANETYSHLLELNRKHRQNSSSELSTDYRTHRVNAETYSQKQKVSA